MRFLIVEENASFRRLLRLFLGGLIDFQTKRVDGLSATRQILAADQHACVLVLADDDQQDLREAAREAGACGYLLKSNLLDLRRFFGTAQL
jgi:DNA-binding NarL/FixJ family response regulator